MLVISRKQGESIIINEDIEIFVLDIHKDKIRIGIQAGKDVKILRKELHDTQKSNMEAANSTSGVDISGLINELKINKDKD